MTRQTSIDAYNQIKEEGLLGNLQFQVYECIVNNGPISQGEAWKLHFPERQRHDIAPRFAELEKKGVIRNVGERPCRVTGRNVYIYQSTRNLPVTFDDPEKIKCDHCNGKGYHIEQQGRLF